MHWMAASGSALCRAFFSAHIQFFAALFRTTKSPPCKLEETLGGQHAVDCIPQYKRIMHRTQAALSQRDIHRGSIHPSKTAEGRDMHCCNLLPASSATATGFQETLTVHQKSKKVAQNPLCRLSPYKSEKHIGLNWQDPFLIGAPPRRQDVSCRLSPPKKRQRHSDCRDFVAIMVPRNSQRHLSTVSFACP